MDWWMEIEMACDRVKGSKFFNLILASNVTKIQVYIKKKDACVAL